MKKDEITICGNTGLIFARGIAFTCDDIQDLKDGFDLLIDCKATTKPQFVVSPTILIVDKIQEVSNTFTPEDADLLYEFLEECKEEKIYVARRRDFDN